MGKYSAHFAVVVCAAAAVSAVGWAGGADSRTGPMATAAGGPMAGAGDGQQTDDIAHLIRELGAPTFMARQHAQRVLISLGVDARSALESAAQNPDHEIRLRAKTALAAIADVDFHVRLGEFISDQNADDGHGLAGWNQYRSLVGTDPAARRLFADMQRAERELLEAVAQRPAHAGTLLDARCLQLESRAQDGTATPQSHYPLGTMAALMFAASNPEVPVSDRAITCISSFWRQSAMAQALAARSSDALVRALADAWVGRPPDHDSTAWYNNLDFAMRYDLKGGIAAALALIDSPQGGPRFEQFAILAVGKLGGREHVAVLEPLLNDDRSVPDRGGRDSDVQIRDVALAAMLHLTGQNLADYGFVHAKTNSTYLLNSNTLGFNDPSARAEALKKWRAWRAQQEK